MSTFSTNFLTSCPVCGRKLRVPVGLLGASASCGHCRGVFQAVDVADSDEMRSVRCADILSRADALLASTASARSSAAQRCLVSSNRDLETAECAPLIFERQEMKR